MRKHLQLFWILTAILVMVGVCTTASPLNAEQASTSSVYIAQAQAPQPGAQPGQQPGQPYPGQQPGQPNPGQQYPGQQIPGQQPGPAGQPPEPSGQQTPGTQAGQMQGVQTFTGMIMKSGDKYVLQDESTGTTYDIDHQDEVAKHVGKRVRLNGTLDPSGKMIHIQPASR